MSHTDCIAAVVVAFAALFVLWIFDPAAPSSPSLPAMSNNSKVVIVIGGGAAGLTAALEASKLGAQVFLFEKEARLGGNSAKASSGINGVGTIAQQAVHSADTPHAFKQDTVISGGGACIDALVNTLVENSGDAVAFLTSKGVDLSVLSKCGGHSYARTHRASPPLPGQPARNIGFEITKKLIDQVNHTSTIHVITNARVSQLLRSESGKGVNGIIYEDKAQKKVELRGSAVVLATGGFAADRAPGGLLERYGGENLRNLPTTNGAWATGDGIRLGEAVGAKLTLMDQVQVHPTGFVDPQDPSSPTKFLAPEALRAVGGILVDKNGKRFVDELALRNQVTRAIFEHGFKVGGLTAAYLLLTEKAVQDFGMQALRFYTDKGFIRKYENAKQFASFESVDGNALVATLTSYNDAHQSGQPDEFGKTTFPVDFDVAEPIYAITITPSIHYTMGGLLINPSAQVLDHSGAVIPSLYAAGEVSGGVHGNNRLAGNSLLECVVFGRIAGSLAAHEPAAL